MILEAQETVCATVEAINGHGIASSRMVPRLALGEGWCQYLHPLRDYAS